MRALSATELELVVGGADDIPTEDPVRVVGQRPNVEQDFSWLWDSWGSNSTSYDDWHGFGGGSGGNDNSEASDAPTVENDVDPASPDYAKAEQAKQALEKNNK